METNSRERSGSSSAEEIETDTGEDTVAVAGEVRRDGSDPDGRGVFSQPWLILSCLLIATAAAFILLARKDAAFVAIALGVSAWFWNMRVRLKRQHNIEKQSRER